MPRPVPRMKHSCLPVCQRAASCGGHYRQQVSSWQAEERKVELTVSLMELYGRLHVHWRTTSEPNQGSTLNDATFPFTWHVARGTVRDHGLATGYRGSQWPSVGLYAQLMRSTAVARDALGDDISDHIVWRRLFTARRSAKAFRRPNCVRRLKKKTQSRRTEKT